MLRVEDQLRKKNFVFAFEDLLDRQMAFVLSGHGI